jgi:hypothetical protein
VRDNIVTLLKAQQADVIVELADETGVTLAPFEEFNRAVHKKVTAPAFTAYRRRVRGITSDEGQLVKSTPTLGLVSTVEGADEDEADDLAELYMLLVDRVVRNAAVEDLFKDLPESVRGLWLVEITEHIYYDSAQVGTRYRKAVEGVLEIGVMEV